MILHLRKVWLSLDLPQNVGCSPSPIEEPSPFFRTMSVCWPKTSRFSKPSIYSLGYKKAWLSLISVYPSNSLLRSKSITPRSLNTRQSGARPDREDRHCRQLLPLQDKGSRGWPLGSWFPQTQPGKTIGLFLMKTSFRLYSPPVLMQGVSDHRGQVCKIHCRSFLHRSRPNFSHNTIQRWQYQFFVRWNWMGCSKALRARITTITSSGRTQIGPATGA